MAISGKFTKLLLTTMPGYIGEYVCKIDAKGRVRMPVGLKKQIVDGPSDVFVVNRGYEGTLNLYPKKDWEREAARFKKLNPNKKKHRQLLRFYFNGAMEVSLDKTDRLLLPKPLLTWAKLENELVLFAYGSRIEIWQKSKYENQMHDFDEDDISNLSDEVWDEINPEE